MTTHYYASRDSDNSRGGRREEDAAMAHDDIYSGTDFDAAKSAMANYMRKEVEWLRRESANFTIALGRPSLTTDARADAIELAIVEVAQLDPAHNERAVVRAAGLVFSLYRRDAA